MGQSVLQSVRLSENKVKRRFLAYLNQRGVVKLTAFCTALNLPVFRKRDNKGSGTKRADAIDRLVTPLLASPECRVEEGKGTAHWEVRYYAKPPEPPSFAPRPQSQVTAYVAPHLKGSWRRERDAAEELREAKNLAYEEDARRERQEAKAWAKTVGPAAPEPELPSVPEPPSPPSPLSQGGEGGQETEIPPAPLEKGGDEDDETTTTEIETMVKRRNGKRAEARTTEECYQLIRDLLAGIGDWPTHHLNKNQLLKRADITPSYFHSHPDLREEVEAALEAEKARRAAVFSEEPSPPSTEEPSAPSDEDPSPPSPLSQGGEGEPETEPPLEDVREDYERQIAELREELERTAAVGLREKLEAQIAALDAELVVVRNEIIRLEGELDRRVADLAALRRTAELLGVAG